MRLSLDTPSDQVILRALREGRLRQAADTLVLIYSGAVYRACRLASAEPGAAEEIAYDTYSAVFSNLTKLRGGVGMKTWLLAEARERVASALLSDVPLEEGPAPLLEGEGASIDREALRRGLDELPARPRALLGVAYGFGLPTFPFREAEVLAELSKALNHLASAIEQGATPSPKHVAARLSELHWRIPERLQRRLEVLCSSLGGV